MNWLHIHSFYQNFKIIYTPVTDSGGFCGIIEA